MKNLLPLRSLNELRRFFVGKYRQQKAPQFDGGAFCSVLELSLRL